MGGKCTIVCVDLMLVQTEGEPYIASQWASHFLFYMSFFYMFVMFSFPDFAHMIHCVLYYGIEYNWF